MIRNYFKIAWRNLIQHKVLSFINIFGLAMGIAFALVIGAWVKYETSFDKFNENGDRIALVLKHTLFNGQKGTQDATPLPLYYELKNNFPEVKRATRLSYGTANSLMSGERKFNKNGRYVDPDFLEMFSFPLIKGDIRTALKAPNSIILTASTANALFGTADPIGKMVKLSNRFDMQVTAVMKDIPANSTLRFDFLAPYEHVMQHDEFKRSNKANWGNNFLMNMLELRPGVSMEAFAKKIGPLNVIRDRTLKNQTLILHPLSKWHLYNDYKNWVNVGGKITYVRLFGIIGIFVLLIACINFMNLSTARSEKRAKEVGIRKAVGSGRNQLIAQFLSEAVLTAFLAYLVALVLIQLLLPSLKDLGFEDIHLGLGNISLLAGGLVICIIAGLIAGSYPALYLSSFLPIRVLKGVLVQGKGPAAFRKVLVVSQFAISIGLIIGTVIVFQQVQHAKSRSIGYDPNNLINVEASDDLAKNFPVLKQELLTTGYFDAVARASQPLTAIYNSWSDFSWEGKAPDEDIALDCIMTEWDFDKAAGLKFKQGRAFSRAYSTDSNAIILNETALKLIGYKDPIGKPMKLGGRPLTIVGVVEDVVLTDPFRPVGPLAIIFDPGTVNNIYLRLKPTSDLKQTLAAIQPIFDKYNPSLPFEYSFADEDFGRKFAAENQAGKLAGIFAVLAVIISCMGLFGLSMFMAERRTKEIGIRKVLGASITNLWVLLSKEFIWLVGIACLIASPLAFWLMKGWLEHYDYRISINWWIFAVAGVIAAVLALLTVSTQTIRAANVNPVKSLKTE
jgi:ABC-type antimicrobial peptide transport system permease subunit